MNQKKLILISCLLILLSYDGDKQRYESADQAKVYQPDTLSHQGNYVSVNGIKMYYEIYGQGKPLVLLHGGGSTIQTTFGRVIPSLARHRKLFCIELQAHGRTSDRDAPLSFEQDADDVAALMKNLNIQKTDIFGFSNGGMTALQIAIRHPAVCNKIVAGSVLLKRDGAFKGFWDFMNNATFAQMPIQYKEAFMLLTPDSAKLKIMNDKCAQRMRNFKDFSDTQLKSIKSPVLLINGDNDVGTSEHIVAMSHLIPSCRLAIIPGGHGEYIGEITTLASDFKTSEFVVPMIERFLNK